MMKGYFDMHTHILPNVDDGAKNDEICKQMLQLSYEQGIRSMMATPHFHPSDKQYSVDYIKEVFERTKRIAETIGIQLFLGNELFYTKGIVEALDEKRAFTLADSDYVLVEFHPESSYMDIYQGLRELVQNGYRPIVAHIERMVNVIEQEKYFEELIELGCLMQMNARSLIGGMMDGQARKCRKYIEKEVIHFLGSDCHNNSSRPPVMETSIAFLHKKKILGDIIEMLTLENPSKVILNQRII